MRHRLVMLALFLTPLVNAFASEPAPTVTCGSCAEPSTDCIPAPPVATREPTAEERARDIKELEKLRKRVAPAAKRLERKLARYKQYGPNVVLIDVKRKKGSTTP